MSGQSRSDVVLLATDNPLTRIVFHRLAARFGPPCVVLEPPVPRIQILRGRLRRLGAATVTGQVLFMALALPLLHRGARARIAEIKHANGLDDAPLPEDAVTRVASANSDEARQILRQLAPRVVLVNGTRILTPATIAAVDAPFLNVHMGITPLYRGVHGGYWALADGRPELAGTTIHLIDEGIDTGHVIEQRTFSADRADNFASYPYLHLATALGPLVEAVERALQGDTEGPGPIRQGLPSRLRSHPTLPEYLAGRFRRGVK